MTAKFTRSPFFTFVRSAITIRRDVAGDLHARDLRRRAPERDFRFEQAVHSLDLREVRDRPRFAYPHRARHRVARAGFDARDRPPACRSDPIVASRPIAADGFEGVVDIERIGLAHDNAKARGWAARLVTVTTKMAYSPTLTCGLSTFTPIVRLGGGPGRTLSRIVSVAMGMSKSGRSDEMAISAAFV